MATTTKRSGFKRSSERKVIDPNEERVATEERRHQAQLRDFESIGFSAGAHSVLVEPLDLSDSWQRCIDFMEAEDASGFDVDGVIW